MSLAVIIPSKNGSNLIPCLTSLRKHEPDCPVIIVDDGLSVQAIDQARFCEPIEIVKGVKPFVFARNVNMGIRRALAIEGNVWEPCDVVILNDDALLESPRGFKTLHNCCVEDPTIGCIGATTNLTGQPLQRPAHKYSDRGNVVNAGWGLRFVPHIAFVCVYIPRRTLDLLAEKAPTDWRFTSGLDERYTAYGSDDLDFCMQVEAAGLKVAVHDGCFVDHSKLHSSFRGAPETPGDIWPNHRLLRAKWGLGPNPQDPQYHLQFEARMSEIICEIVEDSDDPQQGGAR